MSAQIQIPYEDFLIFYWEHSNTWQAKHSSGELPAAASLALAKESIDKLSKQEKSTFIRHKAYHMANEYSSPQLVEVTSFVTKTGPRSDAPHLCAWIKMPDGRRQCESVGKLRAHSASNQDLVTHLEAIEEDYKKLNATRQTVRSKLIKYILKPAKEVYSSAGVPADVAALLPK